MTTSYTRSESESETYSLANAKYVASKIATDLRQVQRYYGRPSDTDIADYALEAALLSHRGYVDKVIYGFQRNRNWILALEYTSVNGTLVADDRAGGIYRHAKTDGTVFTSYLYYSWAWSQLTGTDRDDFIELLPFIRTSASAPGYTGGYLTSDRTYSAHGTGFTRSTYRPL
ncbi:MAG: hypothetical protein ACRDRN_08170 [Sciscionella sp.]